MPKYYKTLHAIQYTGHNFKEVSEWLWDFDFEEFYEKQGRYGSASAVAWAKSQTSDDYSWVPVSPSDYLVFKDGDPCRGGHPG